MTRPLNRRDFLSFSSVVAAGTLAACSSHPVTPQTVQHAAAATPLDPRSGVLVLVTLYGGNDGLGTVIPAADPVYQQQRPDLAYDPGQVLDLGEGLGLNPGMKGLKSLWDRHELAIVRGVGYPRPDHSHFRSMAIWQTAQPTSPEQTGWLGRWLDDQGQDPLHAVSLDPVMPPLMAGRTRSAAAFETDGLRLPSGALGRALDLLGGPCTADSTWQAAAAGSLHDLRTVASKLNPAAARTRTASGGADDDKPGGSAGGTGMLHHQLETVAAMVEMGAPARAYSVSLGGFDTHSDERGTQERLLGELDSALAAFQQRMSASDRGKQVVTLVYSEFGRRVAANASDGTDHGTSGPVFVMGRGVRGGFFGDEPSLGSLDDGDLKVTTDFRSVYATVLDQVLGADPGRYLFGWDTRVNGLIA